MATPRSFADLYRVRHEQQRGMSTSPTGDGAGGDCGGVGTVTTTTSITHPDGRVEVTTVTTPYAPTAVEGRCVLAPWQTCADVRAEVAGWCGYCTRVGARACRVATWCPPAQVLPVPAAGRACVAQPTCPMRSVTPVVPLGHCPR